VLGVGQDITERKKVEMEKALVAQDFRTFIDTANAPIIGIDHNGLVNEWNNMTVEITGFSRAEAMGQDLVKVYISKEFRESVSMVLSNALQGEETANFEFPLFTKNQQRVEVPSGPSARSRTFKTHREHPRSTWIARPELVTLHPDHETLNSRPQPLKLEPCT
jgi:PAS domain S-box-containing protein